MEIIANELQTVLSGANVQFTDDVVPGKACTMHRPGSGLVTLKGVTDQSEPVSRSPLAVTFRCLLVEL